jgi:hypothetical protein
MIRWAWSKLKGVWPALVGLALFVLSIFVSRRRPSDPRSPAERERAERDNEIVLDAIQEHRGIAGLEQVKAQQAGARAAYHGAIAHDAKERLEEMGEAERRAAVERAKARLRRGGGALVVLASLLTASPARADEPLRHPTTGVAGWWMDNGEHLEVDAWILELDARRQQIGDLKLQVAALQRASSHESAAVEMCGGALRATERNLARADREVDRLASWYRDPRFVAPAGVVLGVLAMGGLAWWAL